MLNTIFSNPRKRRLLNIVKYNKKIQNLLNLDVKDYEEYCKIEIEIIPCNNKYGRYINIEENQKFFYHIYFNDNEEEIKNKYEINKKDKITKIKIIIDYQVRSFNELYNGCECI